MTKTEILNEVRDAINNGKTVIITPKATASVWSQPEIEKIPNISANEEINNKLYGITVSKNRTYSPVSILDY